jgi:hypothetical protein
MTIISKASAMTMTRTVACTLALLSPLVAGAQNLADGDAQEVADYVLTEPAMKKYTQAVRNLQPFTGQVPQNCDDESPKSLNDMATRMDAVPQVKSALRGAGMTSREYLLFSLSVFHNGMAAWALEQPGGKLPPGAKMTNVNFYRAHEAELKKLGEFSRHTDCDNR